VAVKESALSTDSSKINNAKSGYLIFMGSFRMVSNPHYARFYPNTFLSPIVEFQRQ
jgi:hypothetical protein